MLRPRLVAAGPNTVEFRRPASASVSLYLVLGGLGWTAYLSATIVVPPWTWARGTVATVPVLFAVGLATLLLRLAAVQPRFDRRTKAFTRGRILLASPGLRVPLRAIHAVQVLREWCDGGRHAFHSYEINVVLRNGKRVHVVDRSGADAVREDARRLAGFLEVPLWDASDVDAPHPPGAWNAAVRFLNRWVPSP